MRPTILLIMLLAVASGCMSLPAGGAAAPAPPTSAAVGATTIVAVAPPATPHPTLWQFLGADQFHADMAAKCQCMLYLLRPYFPVLDGPPPPAPIDDPANLESPNPAVKAAAEVKAEEDAAPAKAQALEYLAKVGCGCYPDVQEALVAGLDDCTEMVRFAAAEALYEAAGHPCQTCKSSSCCGPKVREKLTQIAYETQENGCYFEPSGRVRRVARLALDACGGTCPVPLEDQPEEAPIPVRPPPAPGAEASAGKQARPTPAAAAAELAGAGTAGAAVTRKGIMAASRLRGAAPQDIRTAGAQPEVANDDQGRVVATVDGEAIYELELDQALQQQLQDFPEELSTDAKQRIYRSELLWAIDVRLLLHEVERERRASRLSSVGYAGPGAPTRSPANEAAARDYLEQAGRRHVQVTPDAVLDWYRRNSEQFLQPAAVRWEQVVVPFDKVAGRDEADAVIHRLRQQWLGGRLPPVAEQALDRIRVELVDWTDVTTISPPQMQAILNQLSVGELSPIFEDASGFRMVRVLERRGESIRPLTEVSSTIEEELRREQQQAAERRYLQDLRQRADIWTIIPLAEIGASGGELASTAGTGGDAPRPSTATVVAPPESPAPKAIVRAADQGATGSAAGPGSVDRAKPLLRTSGQR